MIRIQARVGLSLSNYVPHKTIPHKKIPGENLRVEQSESVCLYLVLVT
jgi:hypothetical protein